VADPPLGGINSDVKDIYIYMFICVHVYCVYAHVCRHMVLRFGTWQLAHSKSLTVQDSLSYVTVTV